MAIMVVLGLTAVAPQWLDLKDMVISEKKQQISHGASSISHSVSRTLHLDKLEAGLKKVKYPHSGSYVPFMSEGILTSINHRILGRLAKPSAGSGQPLERLFAIMLFLPAYIFVVLLVYILFIAATALLFFLNKRIGSHFLGKRVDLQSLNSTHKILLNSANFLLSLGIALWVWPLVLLVLYSTVVFFVT